MILADKYIVQEIVGEGAWGIVVRAHHRQLELTVAIKFLKPKAAVDRDLVARFLREGQLAAKIRSIHSVGVHDVGTLDGIPYMVLEYLEGRNLATVLLEEGSLSVERAVDYLLEACEALAEAHALGIIHRDLKPENLFLARMAAGATAVKILDFGVSKVIARKSAYQTGESPRHSITRRGERIGTTAYMSPEQLMSSRDVDPRSDIWSMGVVLHELLAGRRPFEGETPRQVVDAILMERPAPLHTHCPSAPAPLEAVVAKCLSKKPGQRYRNVAELAQDIAPFGDPMKAPARVQHICAVLKEAGESIRPAPSEGRIRVNDLLAETDPDVREAIAAARAVLAKRGVAVAASPRGSGVTDVAAHAAAENVAPTNVAPTRTRPRRVLRWVALGALALVAFAGAAAFRSLQRPHLPEPVHAGPATP
jgi:serine/threonine-protein kinase